MTRLPSIWNPRVMDLAEFRTPVTSLFDSMVTDMFKRLDPFNGLIKDVKTRAYPKVDVRQVDKDLVFEAVVPFVKKEDLDVSIKDGLLRISGDVKKDETIEDAYFVKRELVRSSFIRSFPLNEVMNHDWQLRGAEVRADLKDGILTIKLVDFFQDDDTPDEIDTTRKIDIE